jgi:hypothetical protein
MQCGCSREAPVGEKNDGLVVLCCLLTLNPVWRICDLWMSVQRLLVWKQ